MLLDRLINSASLLWLIKWIQSNVLDPILDLFFGTTTLEGDMEERAERDLDARSKRRAGSKIQQSKLGAPFPINVNCKVSNPGYKKQILQSTAFLKGGHLPIVG